MKFFLLTLLYLFSENAISNDRVVTLTTHNIDFLGSFSDHKNIKPVADETFTGKAVENLRCAFKDLPYTLNILVMPWKRAQLTVKMEQADGFFSASKNTERDKFATLSNTLISQNWTWYYKKDSNIKPNNPNFKAIAKVGAYSGSNMKKWLEDNKYNIAINSISTQDLLSALSVDRVNAILANDKVINSLTTKPDIELQSQKHSSRPLGVYFSHRFLNDHPKFLEQFNLHLKRCKTH